MAKSRPTIATISDLAEKEEMVGVGGVGGRGRVPGKRRVGVMLEEHSVWGLARRSEGGGGSMSLARQQAATGAPSTVYS